MVDRLQIEYRPLSQLRINPRNARTHSDRQVAEIASSIERFGFVNPMLIDRDNVLIAGEGRYRAACQLGLNEGPTIRLEGLTETQLRALALADNRIAQNAGWNETILAAELAALKIETDIDNLGFTDEELDALLDQSDAIEVSEVKTSPVQDRFWISIRGPLRDQALALQRLSALMQEMPDVDVELGTVGVEA